ncbi:MAG: radical SAM protein [Candidatus Thalassarchaeum sp.]|nr:radical SAM protein [Candidatus Thalassarchaeum sp.]
MFELPQFSELPEAPDESDTEGCIQCQMGSKLVLFITGNCHWQCDYCPLSETRRDIDWMFANERRCESFDEVIEEARAMRATGAGITGGDPLMARERTLQGISRLKEEFGPGFHIHMYTSIPFREEWAADFAESGLDEIRFHFLDLDAEKYRDTISACSKAGIITGVEIPCEPDREDDLLILLEELREFDISFLNVNELEITVGNHDNMELRGFNLSTEITAGASGSSEIALSMRDRVQAAERGDPDPVDGMIREPYGFHLKFCTAVYKDSGQMRRRFLRRGEATIAPHEILTDDGTLVFGAVDSAEESMEEWMDEITRVTGLPRRFLLWDDKSKRIEMPLSVAEAIAEEVSAPVSMVEVLPTHERLEVTMVRLNST